MDVLSRWIMWEKQKQFVFTLIYLVFAFYDTIFTRISDLCTSKSGNEDEKLVKENNQ